MRITRATTAPARSTRASVAGIVLAGVLAVSACGSSTSGKPTTEDSASATAAPTTTSAGENANGPAPFPTLTAPSLQPPKQQNVGRPDVVFDPCTWIDDETLRETGYAPESRKRSRTEIHAEYTFLSCQFKSPDRVFALSVLSGNWTMDEGRQKFTAEGARVEDTTIDGRAAMIVRTKSGNTCDVLLQTDAGYVGFIRSIFADQTTEPTPERCEGMVELVETFIPRIGDN